MTEDRRKATGLFDKSGRPICIGNIVHWSDGGDDLPIEDRIKTRWDRIAVVEMERIMPVFRVIDSPHAEVKKEGHEFRYGSFMYADTENYLTVVASDLAEYSTKFKSAGNCMIWVSQQPAPAAREGGE